MTTKLIFLFLISVSFAAIHDDPHIKTALESARTRFLATRPIENPVSRLDATILIKQGNDWARGSHNPSQTAYPASCVKLPYLYYYSMHYKDLDELDSHIVPMIVFSNNRETGVVVDFISNAPNFNASGREDPKYKEFVQKRNVTARFLEDKGFLGNQVIMHKTYPSNTGSDLWGAEAMALDQYGKNLMQPGLMAELMMDIMEMDADDPVANYMRRLLQSHAMWNEGSSFGFGVDPGTVIHNKGGAAYNDLNEIAHLLLPDGETRMIASAFSDGWERESQPDPYNYGNLGSFMHFLLLELNLTSPRTRVIGCDSAVLSGSGWVKSSKRPDKYADSYYQTSNTGDFATWNVPINPHSLYEVSVWAPQIGTEDAVYSLNGAQYRSNQKYLGGRWVRLDDIFIQESSIEIKLEGPAPLICDSVKISEWPNCNGIPGTICQ